MSEHDELPTPLLELQQDLSVPGPALMQSEGQAKDLIAAAMRDADGRPRRRVTRWRRSPIPVALTAIGLGLGSAAAAWVGGVFDAPQVAMGESKAPPPPMPRQEEPRVVAAPAVEAKPQPAGNEDTPPVATALPKARKVVPEPREDLLSKANRLRREGDLQRAEAIYSEVIEQQPGSSAAYVARVAVAKLRLGRNPTSSIALLTQARRSMPGGALDREIRETLVNAYRALGKQSAERRELSELLERYPKGAGAAAARKRLDALDAKQ